MAKAKEPILKHALSKIGKVEHTHNEQFTADEIYLHQVSHHFDGFKLPLLSHYRFPEEKEEEMDFVLREIILNSVSACKESRDKKIRLDAYYGRNGVLFELRDEGPGFNYKKVLSRVKSKPLPSRYDIIAKTLDGGDGINSLRVLTDGFRYFNNGNNLYFLFKMEKLEPKQRRA